MLMAGEGDESRRNEHFQNLLDCFGIRLNNDSVARTVYFRYFHPKEALITDAATSGIIEQLSGSKVFLALSTSTSSFSSAVLFRRENWAPALILSPSLAFGKSVVAMNLLRNSVTLFVSAMGSPYSIRSVVHWICSAQRFPSSRPAPSASRPIAPSAPSAESARARCSCSAPPSSSRTTTSIRREMLNY